MEKLLSKVQCRNFEPGEFRDEKERTKTEIIDVIETYPWERERDHILIDITCPSVTLQNGNLTYLKLALYYNGRFVLYFFDGESLYTKSLAAYKEAFVTIDNYFENLSVNLAEFKKENLLFKHVAKHFVTKDFVYTVNNKRVADCLLETSSVNVTFTLVILIGTAINFNIIIAPAFIFIFLGLFILVGPNILLLLNYYRYVKNAQLKITKGQDIFWFGDVGNMVQYNKKDVYKVAVTVPNKNGGSRQRLFEKFAIYTIYFNNAEHITFNCLLIAKEDMRNKFTRNIQEEVNRTLPFMSADDL